MTEDSAEQRSITDYPRQEHRESDSEAEQNEDSPSPDDPHTLLQWLYDSDPASVKQAVEHLPILINQVREDGYKSPAAGQCINYLLKSNAPEQLLDFPELVTLLGHKHVDTLPLINYILNTYPRNLPSTEFTIDLDFLDTDELSQADRMEGYRALSRLPPDDRIYCELRDTAELFDGVVQVGERYPIGGLFQTYAMRCLVSALQYPDKVPEDCIRRAIIDHPWSSLRIITTNLKQAAEAEVLDHLIDILSGRSPPSDFHHGRIITTLCERYVQKDSGIPQRQVGKLIKIALGGGVYPNHWETIVPAFIKYCEQGDAGRSGGRILALLIDSIEDDCISRSLIDELVDKLTGGNPTIWANTIRVLAESHPEQLSEHTESLVAVTRSTNGNARTALCDALSAIVVVVPQAALPKIEPLIEDLARVSSVKELKDIGEILRSAGVYPPPTELTDLYGSTDEAIDKGAKQIVADLRRQFKNKEPALVPGDPDSVQALSDDYSLVQKAGSVTWESPSLSSPELSVINTVRQAAYATTNKQDSIYSVLSGLVETQSSDVDDAGKSVQLVSPSYESKWVEMAVLGAVFAQIVDPDIEVTLHTPAKGGWGTKKDVKNALQQYGVAPSEDHTEVIPLLDLVPTARMTNDEIIIETTGTTVVDDPPFLTLTRDVTPLANTSTDIILYNYLPGIDAIDAAQIQQWRSPSNTADMDEADGMGVPSTDGSDTIAGQSALSKLVQIEDTESIEVVPQHPEDPVHIELYSIFTAQYAANRRQHIGPPTDLPRPVVLDPIAKGEENVGETTDTHTAEFTSGQSRVDLHRVQTKTDIGEMLAKIEQYADQITDPEIAGALQHFRYTIGSLPVPVQLHDTWIQNQLDQGNKWVPRQLESRKQGIETLVNEAGFDAQILDEATITLETLLDRLKEANPLFDDLLSVLDNAVTDGKRVGVLCNKKTYKDMLDTYLRDRASNIDLGDDVLLLDEDTVRELDQGDVDWLVTFGPLPPQTAIYYHHPTVKKTIVLAYADGTTESRVYGVEHKRRPFLPKRVDQQLPEVDVTTQGSKPDISEGDESFTDDLYRTFLSVASQSRSDDGQQSESSGQLARYRVEFEEIEEIILQNTHPHLVRSDDHLVSTGEYVLRSVSRIGQGDEVVVMESSTQSDLWEEFLREDWKENDDAADTEETFIDAVELWYDAVSAGLQAHTDSSELSDGIGDFAREIEPEATVNANAIKDWARGVYRAESPSDLVFRSDLRIGPRNRDGVKAVAEEYGSERMTDNWEQVFTRIKTIRTTHRKRGSVFWQWLVDLACDGELFNYPGVTRATVTRCQEIE